MGSRWRRGDSLVILHNTSRYPAAEVERLVAFSMRDLDHSRLAVNVKNSSRAYRGRAYDGVPALSAQAGDAAIDRLVTIGIGGPALFPCDNVQTKVKWVELHPEREPAFGFVREYRDAAGATHYERKVVERHGYGGKTAPVLVFHDWREALVAVAAHESRHIFQYQFDRPRSEVEAERFAEFRLTQYRSRLTLTGGIDPA